MPSPKFEGNGTRWMVKMRKRPIRNRSTEDITADIQLRHGPNVALASWLRKSCYIPITYVHPAGQQGDGYFIALTPLVAAMVSCWAVPPLTPMAPISLPSTMTGIPPSDAIGARVVGKRHEGRIAGGELSANSLLGRRNSADVRALACASAANEL